MQSIVCMCVLVPWFRKSTRESTPGSFFSLSWLDFFISNHAKPILKGDDGTLRDPEQLVCMGNKCKAYSSCFLYLPLVKERKVAVMMLQQLCDVVLTVPFNFLWFPSELSFPLFIWTLKACILFLKHWSRHSQLHYFLHQNLFLVGPQISHFQVTRNSESNPLIWFPESHKSL